METRLPHLMFICFQSIAQNVTSSKFPLCTPQFTFKVVSLCLVALGTVSKVTVKFQLVIKLLSEMFDTRVALLQSLYLVKSSWSQRLHTHIIHTVKFMWPLRLCAHTIHKAKFRWLIRLHAYTIHTLKFSWLLRPHIHTMNTVNCLNLFLRPYAHTVKGLRLFLRRYAHSIHTVKTLVYF